MTLQEKLERAEADFREEGVGYEVVELVNVRRDSLVRDFRPGGFYGPGGEGADDEWICVKPPSGYEQNLPRDLVEAILNGQIR